MKHIVRKVYIDFEKEEKFLNEMSAKGFALKDYSWCKYIFEEAPKSEYIYKLELFEHPLSHQRSQEYIKFMEETGVELVTSYNRWAYFRKKASIGEFIIYSDIDSKLKHYRRIRFLFLTVFLFNLFAGLFNLLIGNLSVSSGNPPISLYVSIVSFSAVVLLLVFMIIPLNKKIATLDIEKEIRE